MHLILSEERLHTFFSVLLFYAWFLDLTRLVVTGI